MWWFWCGGDSSGADGGGAGDDGGGSYGGGGGGDSDGDVGNFLVCIFFDHIYEKLCHGKIKYHVILYCHFRMP